MFNLFKTKSSQKLFDDGYKAYKKGQSEVAIDKLSRAIKIEKERDIPNKLLLSNIYCIRGEVYLSNGVAVLSQSDFVQALEQNSQNESALNNLGVWFSIEQFAAPDYIKSLEYLDKAISINPSRKDILLNRAVIKIISGDRVGCDELKKLDVEGYSDAKPALQRYCVDK